MAQPAVTMTTAADTLAKMGIEMHFPPRNVEEFSYWLNRLGGAFTFIEALLLMLVILFAWLAPRTGNRMYARIEKTIAPIARHTGWSIVIVGLLAVLARAAMLPWIGAPQPAVHDEMSILLQAQTFVSGRLANPTHQFWEHFETIYVNQIPAYASMYFPGRGAPLAVGLFLFDHIWAGVWLSAVLMAMAAVWMLQGWVTPAVAFLGGVMIVVRLGIFSSFINSYLGGAFAALGAILVVGALPRILRQPRWQEGMLMASGVGILMIARPYEGALLCVPVALVLLYRLYRPAWQGGRLAFIKVALPATLTIGACGALLLVHNHATTGRYLQTPYDLHRVTYANVPAFLTSPPIQSEQRGPAYLRTFYAVEGEKYESRHNLKRTVFGIGAKLFYSWNYYVGLTFVIPFLVGLWMFRKRTFFAATLVFFYAGYFFETWNFPQYTAPIYPVLLILVMVGFEKLRMWKPNGKPTGLFLTRAIPTAAIVSLLLPISSVVWGIPNLPSTTTQACCNIKFDELRPRLIRQLLAMPGQDLVLIKDGPHNPVHFELVNNEPDIDRSEVIWAHSLGEEKDRALMAYFSKRRMWQFEWQQGKSGENYRLVEFKPSTGGEKAEYPTRN
jgi:hypothetical protein